MSDQTNTTEKERRKAEARGRLLRALPHFRYAAASALEEGCVQIGILAAYPNGGGRVKAQFDADGFFDDLALALDAPPQTEEDDMEAKAVELLQRNGM